ncbi:MAG: HAD-IA family hydrolase [Firmicutes bacterium]|nr:HAD-IA family hydrolase [Bacillota bacterium]
MLRCVLFDLGYTLVYARRTEPFAALLRRVGVEAAREEVAYALHRADQHFMRRHPGLLGRPEGDWLEPYVPVFLRELTGRPPDAALARDLTRLALAAAGPAADRWRAYPDALPTLRRLAARGVVAGVVTNWDGTARRVLETTGLRPWVGPVVVSSECGREKPDPDIFRLALEQAGAAPSEAVMVGDNGHDDVAGALAAAWPLGSALRYFADGWQISKRVGGKHYWRLPVMDGEFVCEATTGVTKQAVGGGNLLVMGRTQRTALAAAAAAVRAIAAVPDVITPFPGGIVRSGSKVGSKYKGVSASINEAYCPTLRGAVASALDPDVGAVLEIVIDGLTPEAVAAAMRAGLRAIIELGPERGALRVGAGNYGGRLGPHHFKLKDLLP